MKIHTETLPKATARLVDNLHNVSEIAHFYLSGGTALSLQLGHRESEDLDFFSKNTFDPQKLQQSLLSIGKLDDVQIESGTLNAYLEGVKLQFLHYPYDLLEETVGWNGLQLSSVSDIACTKLITISARGSKKDFIDLYQILQSYSLPQLFTLLDKKYENVDYNHIHILKSLIYFEDADVQPMPRMHIEAEWEDIKHEITNAVKTYRL